MALLIWKMKIIEYAWFCKSSAIYNKHHISWNERSEWNGLLVFLINEFRKWREYFSALLFTQLVIILLFWAASLLSRTRFHFSVSILFSLFIRIWPCLWFDTSPYAGQDVWRQNRPWTAKINSFPNRIEENTVDQSHLRPFLPPAKFG